MEPTCVLNHVLAFQVLTTELKMGEQRLTNAAGGALWVTKTADGSVTVANADRSIVANVIAADNMASNGVAHIIDAVLLHPASAPPATTTIKATTTITKTTKAKTATRYACNEKTFTCDPSPVGYNSSTLCHEGCVDPTMRYYACDSKTFACNPAPIGYNSSASCQNGCVNPAKRYYACDSKTFTCNPAPVGYNTSAACQGGCVDPTSTATTQSQLRLTSNPTHHHCNPHHLLMVCQHTPTVPLLAAPFFPSV